jgi:hypothetical protein
VRYDPRLRRYQPVPAFSGIYIQPGYNIKKRRWWQFVLVGRIDSLVGDR